MTRYARTIRFYLSYIIHTINSTPQHWLSYRSYRAEEGLHTFLGWRQQQQVQQCWIAHDHTRTPVIQQDYMTLVDGGTYAGQYPCDGWIDDLEPISAVEYASWFHLLSTAGRELKRRAMCLFLERSHRDLAIPPFLLRVLPPLFRTKASQNLASLKKRN